MRNWIFWVLSLGFSFFAFGYETDQYTVPPAELADMGDDLSLFVWQRIDRGIRQINIDLKTLPEEIEKLKAEIKSYQDSIAGAAQVSDDIKSYIEYDSRKLKSLQERFEKTRTIKGIVSLLHAEFGAQITWQEQRDGVLGLPLGYWNYPDGLKEGKSTAFRASKFGIVYSMSGFHRVVSPTYFVFASTLKVYDHYIGVDKIGHLLNQGFQYFEIYNQGVEKGLTPAEALKKAVDWGIESEDGIFGRIVDGVYSNGDLAANFAGFYFFENLFQDIHINGEKLTAQIVREESGEIHWAVGARGQKNLVKPFITAHLDESLNPSVVESMQRGIVRSAIVSRCESWKKFRGIETREQLVKLTENLKLWSNQDYGFRGENTIRLEDICWAP